ncbi:MAG: hypothetical protein K0Q55_3873 [Verrucomicrobia bacterium]|nr:hypothetical protein [Verrucomicrobiota bacterium]
MGVDTFLEAWKKAQGTAPKNFEEDVFWQALYPHARTFAKIMCHIGRPFFQKDLDLIRRIGSVTSTQEANFEIDYQRYQRPDYGLFRGYLRLRISGKRLIHIVRKTLKPHHDTGLPLDGNRSNPVNSQECFPSIS